MSPEANSLVAVVVAVGAALVACAAVGLVLLATRMVDASVRARVRIERAMVVVGEDAARFRHRIEAAAGQLDALRARWVATEGATSRATTSLASARRSLEGITKGRLAMLIRGAGIVSKVAQFALLWR